MNVDYHSSVLLTSYALLLGCLHGLGADHLMAIATLSLAPAPGGTTKRQHPLRVAIGFALGHALLLVAGVAAIVVLGWQIPVLVERTGEVVGGLLLIGLGAFTLSVAIGRRLYGHSHPHGDPPHTHWHLHLGNPGRHTVAARHSHIPGVLGAVFAISGLRALTMMAPFGAVATSGVLTSAVTLVYLVGVFGLGILLSMSLFGIVLSRLVGSPHVAKRAGRAASVVTAVASIALGIYWIVEVGRVGD
jgi:nickel/cobalt exporter